MGDLRPRTWAALLTRFYILIAMQGALCFYFGTKIDEPVRLPAWPLICIGLGYFLPVSMTWLIFYRPQIRYARAIDARDEATRVRLVPKNVVPLESRRHH